MDFFGKKTVVFLNSPHPLLRNAPKKSIKKVDDLL
jgi:hypothetical protein